MMVSFVVQNHFGIMGSYLLVVGFNARTTGVLFRKSFLKPVSLNVFLNFSSESGQEGIGSYLQVFNPFGVEFCVG